MYNLFRTNHLFIKILHFVRLFVRYLLYIIKVRKPSVFYNMRSVRRSLLRGRRQIDGSTLFDSVLNSESRKYACCSAFLSRQLEEAVVTRLFFIHSYKGEL